MFGFKLEDTTGTPAEPETLVTAVPSWSPGDRIFVRPGLVYTVTATRAGVLVVARPSHTMRNH